MKISTIKVRSPTVMMDGVIKSYEIKPYLFYEGSEFEIEPYEVEVEEFNKEWAEFIQKKLKKTCT